ncbi:GtrA family protein [Pseudorhodoferax sp. LjRoot39]|uniref:GtrA family protein n=1 Tax=Pseudorhodoferax sp. LjRoot39 TaxID=3342328 RepID=UPI003ECD0BAC
MNSKKNFGRIFRQFFRYALIGLTTNSLGYLIYLLITHAWGHPKLTMTILYILGALASFLANRRFTFQHSGSIGRSGTRYFIVQCSGYLLNLLLLLMFADWLGFPHQVVQAAAIFVVAAYLFLSVRFFVFRNA